MKRIVARFKLSHMIERDEVYQDYTINNAACSILNQINSQQYHEFYHDDGFLQPNQQTQVNSEKVQHLQDRIDQFLNLEPSSAQICYCQQKNQPQDQGNLQKPTEMLYYQDSGGTKPALLVSQHQNTIQQIVSTTNQQSIINLSKDQKDYSKNLACYMSKTAWKLMFGKYKKKTIKLCQQKGINFEQFAIFCDKKKLSGINGVRSYYQSSDNVTESIMKKIFQTLFQKILRRAYLKTVIKEGKMTNLQAYIEYKNKILLNLDQ